MRGFSQIDVFTDTLGEGNAVAVVHDADDLPDERLMAFARWTQLAETTFLLAPRDPAADYRLRIFTTTGELPFAGHPTLGSARAWLAAGGVPRDADVLVQECGVGLVRLRRADGPGERWAFAAPPLLRGGPVEPADVAAAARSAGVDPHTVVDAAWVDNGPGWVGLLLADAAAVLAAAPDPGATDGPQHIGLAGPYPQGSDTAVEVRAFTRATGTWHEDAVTGSLNASLGQWLTAGGRLPARYVAAQGSAVGRRGRVHVARDGDDVWVGGDTVLGVRGTVAL